MLSRSDSRLAAELQNKFPLAASPYALIARRLGMTEPALIKKVSRLQAQGTIRYIGAVFNAGLLGRTAALVGMRVPAERIKEVAALVNAWPCVSHNYLRDGEYNLWFTVSAGSSAALKKLFSRIKKETAVARALYLPTKQVIKIDARFAVGSPGSGKAARRKSRNVCAPKKVSAAQKKIIGVLNQPWPIQSRPFRALALKAACSEKRILETIRHCRDCGLVRRWGAVLAHRRIGLRANALAAWCVPEKKLSAVCRILAQEPSVSHCYVRATQEHWPYNVYSMLHGPDRRSCLRTIDGLKTKTGITDPKVLFTLKELKKTKTLVGG